MESYWVARIAREHKIPCLALRSVLDPVRYSLLAFVQDSVVAQGKESRRRAVQYILSHPYKIPETLRLATYARLAEKSLSQGLEGIIGRLEERVGVLRSL